MQNLFVAFGILSFAILTANPARQAPYGRFYDEHVYNWGLAQKVNGRIGWFIQELVSPLAFFITYWMVPSYKSLRGAHQNEMSWLPPLLWFIHYLHRAILFPLRRQMSPTRADIVFYSIAFNIFNGYQIAKQTRQSPPTLNLTSQLGCVIWLVGFCCNVWSDEILRRGRARSKQRYVLPNEGPYKYILSPNYLFEIMEWTGFAMIVKNKAAAIFAFWTFCNLAPRARGIRGWYQQKFGVKAVGNRAALIPHVY